MKPGTTRRGGFDWPRLRSIEEVEKLKDETVGRRLAALGAAVEGDELLRLVERFDSAGEAALNLEESRGLGLTGYQREWLAALVQVHWTRLLPDRLPVEEVHERLHLGYDAFDEGDAATAVELWTTVWMQLDAIAQRRGLDDPAQVQGVLGHAHDHGLFDWLDDFEDAFLQAADDDPGLSQQRIDLGRQVLARFGGKDPALDRLAIWLSAFGHADAGEEPQARALIERRLESDAVWGEGWRGLALLDSAPADHDASPEELSRAEAVLRKGLEVPAVERKEALYEALEELLSDQERWDEAARIREEWEADEEASPPDEEEADEDDESFDDDEALDAEDDLDEDDLEEEDDEDAEGESEEKGEGAKDEPPAPPKPGRKGR